MSTLVYRSAWSTVTPLVYQDALMTQLLMNSLTECSKLNCVQQD